MQMRVTFNMLSRGVLTDIASSSELLLEAQKRASSGKRILKPSDDVGGTGRSLNLRSTLAEIEQYLTNSNLAKNQLQVTNSALDSVVASVQRVRTIALQAANSTMTPEARQALGMQLDEISKSLAGTANTQYGGKYIFGGTATAQQPLIASGVAMPPYTYAGNDSQINIQISPWTSIASTVTANAVFNMDTGTVPTSNDMFSVIQDLKDKVLAGDSAAISQAVLNIDEHLKNVTTIRSEIGGRIATLDSVNATLLDSKTSFSELLSRTEDADLAQTVLDLQTRQNMYQAALATAGRVLSLSLADYIK